jgi:hypothetical protein
MLFKFGMFWKTALSVFLSWTAYVLLGFEFTLISMLAILIVIITKDKHFLV